MNVNVSCKCGKKLSVPDEFAGRKIKCSACGGLLIVPNDEEIEEVDEVVEEEAEAEEVEEERAPEKPKERKKEKAKISDKEDGRSKLKSKAVAKKKPKRTLLFASACAGAIAVVGFIVSGVLLIMAD